MLPLFSRNSQIIKIMNNNNQVLFDATNVDSKIISAFTPFYFKSNGNNLTNYEIYGNDNGVGNYDSITQKYLIPIKITGESTSQTITLSLDTALMEGQKITLTDTNINIPTYNGRNIITIETETQPAMILIKGQISFISIETKSIYTINYYNGSTLLGTEIIEAGLGERPQAKGYGSTPTKASTSQYTYTFAGWNENPNATSADENALTNVTTNRTVYAIFTQQTRTYTVTFYNGNALLETVQNVPYGATATYSGTEPTKEHSKFTGWSPANTNITENRQCYAQFNTLSETITDSWSEIIANIDNGTYSSKYSVGQTKIIDVGTEGEVAMQIVAIDADVLAADNSKTAPITWVSKQLLPTGKKMANTANNIADWRESELRTYLRTTVFDLLPQIVQENILEVTKTSCLYYYNNNSYIPNMTSSETVWIPSARELGDASTFCESSGVIYTILNTSSYSNNTSKAVFGNDSNEIWWTRSAKIGNGYGSYAYTFRTVNTVGQLDNYMSGHVGATFTHKFPLCFCLGGTQYTINYYSQDGQTLLYSEKVSSGNNGTFSGTPKKASTAQYNYTFVGWNTSTGQTTATANVLNNITADTDVYAAFSKTFKTDTISDSWEDIIANCNNGTYTSKYQIGDLKTIDVGTEGPVQMQIVAIDTDVLADSTNTAPITWISKQLLNTSHRMNPSEEGALGGWEDCEMRSYLINTIKPLIPSEVRNALKMVKKYSKIYNTSGAEVNNVVSNDDIWIPSVYEVRGFTGYETSGVTYSTAFPDNASRIKHKVGGSAAWWWLRSAYHSGAFKGVTANGQDDYYGAGTTSNGVALGFCT